MQTAVARAQFGFRENEQLPAPKGDGLLYLPYLKGILRLYRRVVGKPEVYKGNLHPCRVVL
jgi:hypothetical protein